MIRNNSTKYEKKIIFFCPSIEIGGVEKNLYKVINFLAQKNIDLYLVTLNKNINKKFNKKIQIINKNFLGGINYPYFLKVVLCVINYFLIFGLKKITYLFLFNQIYILFYLQN